MAQNITLMGASYSNVPAVTLPKTGGGTARFDDATVTTATASDVASGKVFLASDGTITTGTASGGGGTLTVKTATVTHTATSQTLSFSSLSGQPKYWYLRITSQLSSSGSTTYYYITNLFYDGTNIKGNSFRIGSTRRIYNITSGISQSYSSGTLTITGGSSTGASPGQFYGASSFGYELVYIY